MREAAGLDKNRTRPGADFQNSMLSDSDTTGEGGVTYAQVIKVRCFQFAGMHEEIPAIVAGNEAHSP
jgi:hypothetical protein